MHWQREMKRLFASCLVLISLAGCKTLQRVEPTSSPWTSGIIGKTNGVWMVEDAFMLKAYEWKKCCEQRGE